MRNPMYNDERNRSRDKEALEPVPESYVGDNNPYRGIEQHGVENPNKPTVVPGYGDTYQVELEHEEPAPDPVPVYVVNQGAHERREWDSNNTFIDSTRGSIEILPNDPRRTTALIVNSGPNTVYIGRRPSVTSTFGFPVAVGGTYTTEAETNVYGATAAGETASLRVVWEYRLTMRNG